MCEQPSSSPYLDKQCQVGVVALGGGAVHLFVTATGLEVDTLCVNGGGGIERVLHISCAGSLLLYAVCAGHCTQRATAAATTTTSSSSTTRTTTYEHVMHRRTAASCCTHAYTHHGEWMSGWKWIWATERGEQHERNINIMAAVWWHSHV